MSGSASLMIQFVFEPVFFYIVTNFLLAYWLSVFCWHFLTLVTAFLKIFQNQKDENWGLPILFALTLDLRLFANNVSSEILQWFCFFCCMIASFFEGFVF